MNKSRKEMKLDKMKEIKLIIMKIR